MLCQFGGFYTGSDKVWQDAFAKYIVDRGFGAFYFGLNPTSEDTGGLLLDDWTTPHAGKLGALAQLPSTRCRTAPLHQLCVCRHGTRVRILRRVWRLGE